MRNTSGFTIVELLVVIVVIGVLASVTVVAFNGIQDRSRNAKMQTAMDTLEKALRLHATEFGSYPRPTDVPGVGAATGIINAYACVQPTSGGWPVQEGLSATQCVVVGGSQPTRYGYSTLLQQALLAKISKIPDTSDMTQNIGYGSARGILYNYVEDPSATYPRGYVKLMYFIKSDQTCARGTKYGSGGGANCVVDLP